MEIKRGIPVSAGVGIGEVLVLGSEEYRIPQKFISLGKEEDEVKRFERALEVCAAGLRSIEEEAAGRGAPETVTRIVQVHLMLLSDPTLKSEVCEMIRKKGLSPEHAVSRYFRRFTKLFKGMRDEYFAQRFADIQDIERRLLRQLLGERREDIRTLTKPVVVVAHDLTPSQTASMHPDKVRGFAAEVGGSTSHTAIVARSLGIPAVVGLGAIVDDLSGGDTVIIDGTEGVVIISPDEVTLRRYQEKRQAHVKIEATLDAIVREPAQTKDGKEVRLFANIEFPHDIELVVRYHAAGVGLFRTEFLCLDGAELPTERGHIEAYKQAIRLLAGRPLVIRTFDFGADKLMIDTGAAKEANPFLGFRSIRFCFERLDLFKPQLRAILRASAMGNVKLLLPMISSLEELQKAKFILKDVMDELGREGISFDEQLPIGIMVEIPSAVEIIDLLAPEVDFFSIGTNDLIQYSLAVDRVNERVAALYQPAHPAILRYIRRVIEVGRQFHRDVALCGEMSSDVLFTSLLLGLGLEEFSVIPAVIPEVKRVIRGVTMEQAREIAAKALSLPSAADVLAYLRRRMPDLLPDVFARS